MRKHTIVWMLAVLSLSCNEGSIFDSELNESKTPLEEGMNYWRSFAPICDGAPSKGKCDDGDMLLFSSLLCASGNQLGCESVRDSQAYDGQFWRSPRRIGDNLGRGNAFSRDMATGVLLYLTVSKDVDAAQRWLEWIKEHKECPKHISPRIGCVLPRVHSLCDDTKISYNDTALGRFKITTLNYNCIISPNVWGLMRRVWDHLGLEPSKSMKTMSISDKTILKETQLVPPGYQLHIKVVRAYILRLINSKDKISRGIIKIAHGKQPQNPFFGFLRKGGSEEIKDNLLDLCPKDDGSTFRKHQWSWERDTKENAWKQSMGWDCLFMGNLLGAR